MISNIKTQFLNLSKDEQANTLTHALGLILTLGFSGFLIQIENIGLFEIGKYVFIFGLSMMFICSSLYHFEFRPIQKEKLRVLDHISIFILIGASYTPYVLRYFNTTEGHYFLLFQWLLIVFGIIFKLIFKTKYEIFSLIMYVVLGWMVVFVFKSITKDMAPEVFNWLIFGGLSYTVGILFYVSKKLKYAHSIWHIFVILGGMGHFISLYQS